MVDVYDEIFPKLREIIEFERQFKGRSLEHGDRRYGIYQRLVRTVSKYLPNDAEEFIGVLIDVYESALDEIEEKETTIGELESRLEESEKKSERVLGIIREALESAEHEQTT